MDGKTVSDRNGKIRAGLFGAICILVLQTEVAFGQGRYNNVGHKITLSPRKYKSADHSRWYIKSDCQSNRDGTDAEKIRNEGRKKNKKTARQIFIGESANEFPWIKKHNRCG